MFKIFRALEKWFLTNLSVVCFLIVLILIIMPFVQSKIGLNVDNKFLITSIGATLVFWYSYKKYERDKELENIKHYTEKYNFLMEKLCQEKSTPNYTNLLNLWYEEYYLADRKYISKELWDTWSFWIEGDIHHFLNNDFSLFAKEGHLEGCFMSSVYNFIDHEMSLHFTGVITLNRDLYYNDFSDFILKIIRKFFTNHSITIEDEEGNKKTDKDMKKFMQKTELTIFL